jgi:hypothetical protein
LSKDEHQRTSRRRVLQGGLGVIAVAAAATTTLRAADAQEKLAQNLVQYQDTPKNGVKCGTCINYIDPAACKIVEGKISPDGWCVAYAPKNG